MAAPQRCRLAFCCPTRLHGDKSNNVVCSIEPKPAAILEKFLLHRSAAVLVRNACVCCRQVKMSFTRSFRRQQEPRDNSCCLRLCKHQSAESPSLACSGTCDCPEAVACAARPVQLPISGSCAAASCPAAFVAITGAASCCARRPPDPPQLGSGLRSLPV
jgi:hypothetical protein